jgi:hypothetical protein
MRDERLVDLESCDVDSEIRSLLDHARDDGRR